jgi:nucleotide-binding universal stress UspA family protein
MTPGRGRADRRGLSSARILMEAGMSLKDIVVFLDPFVDTETRLKVATSLARAHGARVTGVDVSTRAALEGSFHFAAGTLEQLFNETVAREGIDGVYKVAGEGTQSWKDFYAHYADLVVASQHDPASPKRLAADIVEPVLLSSGVPVLILPLDWSVAPIGKRIALAWNASREATRAAHDALPLLRGAEKVVLFDFAPQADLTESGPELMADHLRKHGVNIEVQTWPAVADSSLITALFASLDENYIDLIVAGAYGHSRVFEGLFGGVSRDLLHQPSMPVLMSH